MNAAKSLRSILILSLVGLLLGSPLSVQAQVSTGTISGLVQDADNNPILTNIPIVISSEDGSFMDSICTETGAYQFSGLPLDTSYIVEAAGNGVGCIVGHSYAREYWPNAAFINSASAVELTPSTPNRNDIDFTLDPGGSISGVVHDTDGSLFSGGRVSIALVLVDSEFPVGTPTEIYTCTNPFTVEYELKHIPLGYEYKVAANVFPCPNNAEGFATINAWPDSPTLSGGTVLTPTVADPNLTGRDFTLPVLGDTPAGNDVLTYTSNGFVTFDSVSAAGTTTTQSVSNPPPTPSNFHVLGEYYDVSTTASFTNAQVCLQYIDPGFTQFEESLIGLFHFEDGIWVNVTDDGYPLFNDNVVCGTVTSFSPFVIAQTSFSGFFQPVDNLPTLNLVKAGSAIPGKFSLGGYQGINIFDSGYPKSQIIVCDSTAVVDGIEETLTTNSSGLSYDPDTDRYTYVWKTDKNWTGTCRQLVIKFTDGTIHRANFKFK